jgi:hypothetical protein
MKPLTAGTLGARSGLSCACSVSALVPSSLGVDPGRLFAALEDEVRAQLRHLSEKPLET